MKGEVKAIGDLDQCEPVIKNSDIKTPLYSWGSGSQRVLLNPDDPANPCGLVAKSYFTGNYLKKEYKILIWWLS